MNQDDLEFDFDFDEPGDAPDASGTSTAPPPRSRETRAGVLGVTLGLALIGAAVYMLVVGRVETIDAQEAMRAHFDYEALPYDLVLGRASRLPRGDVLISMFAEGHEPAAPSFSSLSAGGDSGADERGGRGRSDAESRGGGMPWVDWSKVPVGEEGQGPISALLVEYPLDVAEDTLKEEFAVSGGGSGSGSSRRSRRFGGGGGGGFIGPDGGTSTLGSGRLDWHGLGPAFLHQRRYFKKDKKPTFQDRVRINLSLGGRCRVLYLGWDERAPASKEAVEEALLRLRPLAADLEALKQP